ncbi:Protein of unknown function [Prosthecobacter debontii]|uniref:DUF1800 family protein n=1 Tax=Prosthecobacter debontii TaxID=48467 RepID=A0A1T4XC48_9BACT|nr:DUF1800 family protein [Prosthecobacter debontii]SKA86745.1 Protein of unknown function [Prosthecobacter debontii]
MNCRSLLFAITLLGILPEAQAEFRMVWSLGAQDGRPEEFGDESWGTNAPPGSASARDNDFYFAGAYPPPIGGVAAEEPWTHLERAVSPGNPLTRLHFNLTAEDVTATLRVRFVLHHVWGYMAPSDYGRHELEIRLNGTVLLTETVSERGSLVVEATAADFTAHIGENILQITRTGGDADAMVQWDALTFEVHPTGMLDADEDGLLRWWEEDHNLDDTQAEDAQADPDGDGLTTQAEFQHRTDPWVADTDQDGLSDGGEVARGTNPLLADTDGDELLDGEETVSNPTLKDTDGDGYSDPWELSAGFNPADSASHPPAWDGAIALHFVSDLATRHGLAPEAVSGFAPQPYWNHTKPLTSWGTPMGTQAAIVSPQAGLLVNSAGDATDVTLNWSTNSGFWASNNGGSSIGKLFSGFFSVNNEAGGTLSLSNIPYPLYDVIVYVGGVYDGGIGSLRLNDNAGDDRWFATATTAPANRFVEPLVSSEAVPWTGNTIRFRNVTGSSFNLKLFRSSWHEVGIHGLQIVNADDDADEDGIPTWWELKYHLNPSVNDAAGDADLDDLSNFGEWQRQTDPLCADTDGDGLKDGVESQTGIWVNVTDTGSHPLLADTDGDGLTDGFEVNLKPQPTNPNQADSDGDGRSDAEEIQRRTDPRSVDGPLAQMPVVTTSPRQFIWIVDNVQIVWDHMRGHVIDQSWGDNRLMSFQLANSAGTGVNAFDVALRVRGGRLSYFFYSSHDFGFSHPDSDNDDIWAADWVDSPTDLKPEMGFSGYGRADISDRLSFQIIGSSTGSQTAWNFTFNIVNQDTGETVVSRDFNGCRLATNVHHNTVSWQDLSDPPLPHRLDLWEHPGVQVYFQSSPLEETPAFAAFKDTDEDGMPDVWEDFHALNKNSAADASVDDDLDGLSNLREYLSGTSPNDRDSDDDGAPDGLEVESGSNPLLASSLPPFYHGVPSAIANEDFNGNGMPDAWEQWSGGGVLEASLDSDHDGLTNQDEAAAGTDPFDAASKLSFKVAQDGQDLRLRWSVLPLKGTAVWQSANLTQWQASGGEPTLSEQEFEQTFAGALQNPVSTFYRLAIEDRDSDADGVSDWTEVHVLGSDPHVANSLGTTIVTDEDEDGNPEGSLSGELATLLEQFSGGYQGAAPAHTVTRSQAARFLMQASFGPTLDDIRRVQSLGYEAWVEEQAVKAPTLHSTYIRAIYDDMLGQRSRTDFNRGGEEASPFLFGNNMMTTFARASIQGEDQLRQRMAFALSQILVTSRRDANLENRCLGMADYYDIFVRNALGNYYDVLMEVTLHPVMGRYLSHVGNQKADPAINRYPDENFARELMQLFSIGLWELNPNGTRKLDVEGHPIPTYSNAEITQLARVMTGFWFGGHNWGGGGWTEPDFTTPMTVRGEYHDFGKKVLLGGCVLPARAATDDNALRDVRDAVRHLFEHANTPVFISRQLIQFMVTDNPSPAYVARVSAVFADNGNGVRGDLKAVLKAILLDDEARDPRFTEAASYGRLKEPVIRAMALARAFGMKDVPDLLWWDWGDFFNASRQEPTYSPSVFNFYRPDYKAPGLLTQKQLSAPVFQITDSFSSIAFPNRLWQILMEGFSLWETYRFPLDLSREEALAGRPEALVDHLNLLFCAGRMRPGTRALILEKVSEIPAEQTAARAQVAAYLALVCPEGAVMK